MLYPGDSTGERVSVVEARRDDERTGPVDVPALPALLVSEVGRATLVLDPGRDEREPFAEGRGLVPCRFDHDPSRAIDEAHLAVLARFSRQFDHRELFGGAQ